MGHGEEGRRLVPFCVEARIANLFFSRCNLQTEAYGGGPARRRARAQAPAYTLITTVAAVVLQCARVLVISLFLCNKPLSIFSSIYYVDTGANSRQPLPAFAPARPIANRAAPPHLRPVGRGDYCWYQPTVPTSAPRTVCSRCSRRQTMR